jgi:hypothetical protein
MSTKMSGCRIEIEKKLAQTQNPVFMVDAINQALDEELAHNPKTLIYGQDVAKGKGGVFTVTAGLTEKHGLDRCFNSPLAEASIVGTAIGLATLGYKPVVEIQFGDYVWTGMMQIQKRTSNSKLQLKWRIYLSSSDQSCSWRLYSRLALSFTKHRSDICSLSRAKSRATFKCRRCKRIVKISD